MKRLISILALAVAADGAWADTGDDAAQTSLTLAPGTSIEIVCDTKAVVVATDKANASNGAMRLRLARDAEPGKAGGRWTPLSHDGSHQASLAAMQAKTCADGCPLSLAADGAAQLWAPAAKSLDKLGADELLLLAVVKASTMEIKASTFRGQQIEALESGRCRQAPPAPEQAEPSPKS